MPKIVTDKRGNPSTKPCSGSVCDPVDAWYWREAAVLQLTDAQSVRDKMTTLEKHKLQDLWSQVEYQKLATFDFPVLVNRLAVIAQDAADLADHVRTRPEIETDKPPKTPGGDSDDDDGGDVNIDPDIDIRPSAHIGGSALPLFLIAGVAAVFVATGPLRAMAKVKRK